MINSDAVLTDGEIRQQIINLLTEYHRKSDIAPTLTTDGQVLKRRIEKGWTPEQIIETPIVASVN